MLRSSSRSGWLLAVCAGLLAASAAQAQIAVVAVRSVDALRADTRYLAKLIGEDARSQALEAVLKQYLDGKNGGGLDAKKPFGAYALWPEKIDGLESLSFPVVAFMPVADEKLFLGLLEDLKWKPRKTEDGLFSLSVSGDGDHYLRFVNGHAYVAKAAPPLRGKLPEPAALLPAGGAKSLLTASLRVEQLPREFDQLVDMARDTLCNLVGKSERDGVRKFADVVKGAAKELRAIDLAVEIDPAQERLAIELTFVPRRPDGDPPRLDRSFAALCQQLGTARSRFSQLTRQAPVGMFIHVPGPEGDGKKAVDVPDQSVTVFEPFVDARYRGFLKLVPIFVKAFRTDGLDYCLIISGRESNDDVSGLAGLKVPNGRQIDHAFRDVLKELPTELKDDFVVEWNHARQGDARIHKITRFMGEAADAFLGIREDVIFCGGGKHGLKSVKDALGSFNKGERPATPALELTVSSAGFLLFKDVASAVEKALPAEERDKLRARVSLVGGKDLRLRVEVSVYLLKLVAKHAREQ
jgi:hypothetical protein